jgi:ribosomal protein S18 acetylase RimI-like enzyme
VTGGQLTITKAGAADASLVATMVLEIATHEESAAAVLVDEDRWRSMLGRDDVVVLVASDAEGPVGYVSAIQQLHLWSGGDILALDDLWVRERARNRGVGERLMRAITDEAQQRALEVVRWGVECDNVAAQRFYARLGARLHTKVIATWRPAGGRTGT